MHEWVKEGRQEGKKGRREEDNKPSGDRRQGSEEKKPRVARLLSRRFGTWINEWTNGRVVAMR